jgi:beta-galactosidase/beta-glucuronidase
MRRCHPVLILLGLVLVGPPAHAADALRQRLNINRDWKFMLGDHPGAETAAYNDSKWEPIGLPHSFSAPYFQSKDFYTGYGWYRKNFNVPASWSGKRLFLEFDGAFQDAEVFVNGKAAGRHLGGYTGFSFDITSAAKPGENLFAVRLNNNWNPRLAPRAGDHLFAGGIYRDVWLWSPIPCTLPGTAHSSPRQPSPKKPPLWT